VERAELATDSLRHQDQAHRLDNSSSRRFHRVQTLSRRTKLSLRLSLQDDSLSYKTQSPADSSRLLLGHSYRYAHSIFSSLCLRQTNLLPLTSITRLLFRSQRSSSGYATLQLLLRSRLSLRQCFRYNPISLLLLGPPFTYLLPTLALTRTARRARAQELMT